MQYGTTTAAAVLNYKRTHVPPIINKSYQDTPDDIVGQMTIKAMDQELFGARRRNDIADRAFADSRAAVRIALNHLRGLRDDIRSLPATSDPAFGSAMANLLFSRKRDIAVFARRMLIVPDPSSTQFRDNLGQGHFALRAQSRSRKDDPRRGDHWPL